MTGERRGLRQGKKKWHFEKTSLLRRILDAQEAAITRRIDWAITAVACVVLLCLHIALYRHSGAFWRDETYTLHLAQAPSWETMWSLLGKDSAPALMFGSVRLWIAAGPGATDEGLRLFGMLVSLAIMASLFVSCWTFTARVPLVGTALVLFSGAVFYYGSSLRAYGLAVLLIMPCCAAFWRVCLQPSRWNVLASLILAVLAGHASYQNSYLLLAIGLAGASVCGVCRLWKRSILVLTICFIAALSMLVYLPAIREYRDASHVQRFDLEMSVVGGELAGAISMGSSLLPYAWFVVASSSSICLLVQIVGCFRRRSVASATPCLPLYLAMVAILATTVGLGFLKMEGIFPYPWHYVPLIALAGLVIEVAFQSQQERLWVWGARAAIACLMVTLSLPVLWEHAHLRRSNFDCIGAVLAEKAGPNDFILVYPYSMAPGFKYYWRVGTPWNTLPLTSTDLEVALNGSPYIKRLMSSPDAITPTLEKIKRTLASGHRLFIVGNLSVLPANAVPPRLPPAPLSRTGWTSSPYLQVWSMQVGYFLRRHAKQVQRVPVDVPQPVNKLENLPVICVEGWRDG